MVLCIYEALDRVEGYFTFTRETDVLASLEGLSLSLERTSENERAWKFAIISAHLLLQGSISITLREGNGFQTRRPKQLEKWLKAYENGQDLPLPQLDNFMELFDRTFDDADYKIDRDLISWLNETRNGLIHFNTDSYSIETGSMIAAIQEAVKAAKLGPKLANGIFFYDEQNRELFELLCRTVEDQLIQKPDA